MRALAVLLAFGGAMGDGCAGVLTPAELARRFPAPLLIGPKQAQPPVWPVFKQNGTATELVGYVFESGDLAPIPGFAGVPMNMLVALDPKGNFISVDVMSHHEPVFLDGLGEAPLRAFASQYRGLSLKQNIHIDSKARRASQADPGHAYLDGVSRATASVRILNQSVLSAALKVARARLGFAQGRDPEQIARIGPDKGDKLRLREMIDQGLIQHLRLSNGAAERLFAGSPGSGLDPLATASPDGVFIDLYLAWVSVPAVGRSLLAEDSWRRLTGRLEEGDHAFLIMSSGRYSVIGDDVVRGTVSERLLLRQARLPIDLRDLDMDLRLADGVQLPADRVAVFRVIAQAGLDPALPLDFVLPLTRLKGVIYPERIVRDVAFSYRLPPDYYVAASASGKGWRAIWRSRLAELLLLAAALGVLTAALLWQKKLTGKACRFDWFRRSFLVLTIVFIGYYAQGQLSIINLTGMLQALIGGRGLAYMMFDPMTVCLGTFVAASLFVWGRGTYCGWLCPFGALQELTGKLGQALRFPQLLIRPRMDARLKRIKYLLLAGIGASAVFAPALTDMAVELEPFKTAITLNFRRDWPFVAYAAGLLVLSMFSYKFFCRYLCPLGASLALPGRLRLMNWIPRRAECGTPCQTCRHRCEHHAIGPAGTIDYAECFQCMDCVVIYENAQKCAPLLLEVKRARTIRIEQVREH